ncbi:hypothetical protein AVEN_244792-1 [Araneus ventricosus]|uniref:Nose resistant-to-fluoxetine protein N-terminal domain-containing protein n=1 Tax=Araneus ventricosus TaxID=182803 RepID=A0A4Y2IFC3_ARAVE|nr:hypothetical protein AVEN_244792-1 [Araneus ventricosus]
MKTEAVCVQNADCTETPQSVAFAAEMLSHIENEHDFLNRIIFSDEATFQVLSNEVSKYSGFQNSSSFHFAVLDASGRLPEGFLQGTLTSLGNYQECVEIRVNESRVNMKGQYCTVIMTPPLPDWKPFTSMHVTVPEMFNISAPDSVSCLSFLIFALIQKLSIRWPQAISE